MSQAIKIILIAIVAALIGGAGVYFWQQAQVDSLNETIENLQSANEELETDVAIKEDVDSSLNNLPSYVFGEMDYELDYPSAWAFELEPKGVGQAWDSIVFSDANGERKMSSACGFMGGGIGGYGSVITESNSRTVEKGGEETEISYTVYSLENKISLIAISTPGCYLFIDPDTGEETAQEIYQSIR